MVFLIFIHTLTSDWLVTPQCHSICTYADKNQNILDNDLSSIKCVQVKLVYGQIDLKVPLSILPS